MNKNKSRDTNPARFLEAVLEHGATVCFILFFLSVILQVFFRFVLQAPLIWSEETARYFNLWAVALGGALGVLRKEHLRLNIVDKVMNRFPKVFSVVLDSLNTVIALLFSVIVLFGSVYMTVDNWEIPLTVLPLPQGVIYLALAISFTVIIISLLVHLIKAWRTVSVEGGSSK